MNYELLWHHLENTHTCYVMLWRLLRVTRRHFYDTGRRFCIRNILRLWLGLRATDTFIFDVCTLCEMGGYDLLPAPSVDPLPHRLLLMAIMATRLGTTPRHIDLRAIDSAYSEVFSRSLPSHVARKRKEK